MRKLILKMSVSVDGFVSGPNGELEWVFDSIDDEVTAWIVDTLWQAGVHIMGSVTYNDMAAYWPNPRMQSRRNEPFAAPMNEIPLEGGLPLFKNLPGILNPKLQSVTTFPSGVVAHVYERAEM